MMVWFIHLYCSIYVVFCLIFVWYFPDFNIWWRLNPSFLTKMFYKFHWEMKMFFDKIKFLAFEWNWCFQAEAIGKHRRFVFLWLRWVLKLKAFIIHQISKSWSQIELCFALWSFYWAFNLWKKFWKNEFLTMLHNKILQHKFQY